MLLARDEREAGRHVQLRYLAGSLPSANDDVFWGSYPSITSGRRQPIIERAVRIAEANQAISGYVGNPLVDDILAKRGLHTTDPANTSDDHGVSTYQVTVRFTHPQGGSRYKVLRDRLPPGATGGYIADMVATLTNSLRAKYGDVNLAIVGAVEIVY